MKQDPHLNILMTGLQFGIVVKDVEMQLQVLERIKVKKLFVLWCQKI